MASTQEAERVVFSLFVPGRPVSWARTNTHKGRRITPKKQKNYAKVVKQLAITNLPRDRPLFNDRPLCMSCVFTYEAAKNPKYDKYPVGTPDVDNLYKLIADALEGLVYRNDSQIAQALITKEYSERKEQGVAIHVEPLPLE